VLPAMASSRSQDVLPKVTQPGSTGAACYALGLVDSQIPKLGACAECWRPPSGERSSGSWSCARRPGYALRDDMRLCGIDSEEVRQCQGDSIGGLLTRHRMEPAVCRCAHRPGSTAADARRGNPLVSPAAFRALAEGRLPAGVPTEGCPRLRFDRVAQRLVRNLQQVLCGIPSAKTALVVTVTAPIRSPASTVQELRARISKPLRRNFSAIIAGNRVRARLLARSAAAAPGVIVFVHNPEPAPTRLFELAAACLSPALPKPRMASLRRGSARPGNPTTRARSRTSAR
jgi:hypothetical protein